MSTQPSTHYQSLGIASSASLADIRRAYRALAKLHHPDVNRAAGAQASFATIALAYEILSNPDKRRDYDAQLARARLNAAVDLRPHYTWTNIAAEPTDAPPARADLDDLYDTFFAPPPPRRAAPGQSKPPSKSRSKSTRKST